MEKRSSLAIVARDKPFLGKHDLSADNSKATPFQDAGVVTMDRRTINTCIESGRWNLALRVLGLLAVGTAIAVGGCQEPPWVDPWQDDALPPRTWSTPSAEGVLSAEHPPAIRHRETEPSEAPSVAGEVPHFPLWWEDPFEDKGSTDNGQFAWTREDYIALAYCPGRFLLNTMAFPVSAWMTKPGTVMCSDGKLSRQRLGYDHDAAPCPGGTMPPIDVLEVGTYHEEPIAQPVTNSTTETTADE